jgi:16S rRNA (adenine1518-N6/adenine1519-N6)-dimethyltransferase
VLTARLLDAGARVLAVEVDPRLAALLEDLFADRENLTLIRADVLRGKHHLNPDVLEALGDEEPWRVVANLPYQVASPVTADLVALPRPPFEILVTVQAEVAERMASPPGRPEYGPLAAVLALAGGVERIRDLPPEVFWPRPKVRSAIVRIRPDAARRAAIEDWRGLEAFLRAAFHHRRKTLRQGLAAGGRPGAETSSALRKLGHEANVRAEDLAPGELAALWRALRGGGQAAEEGRRSP